MLAAWRMAADAVPAGSSGGLRRPRTPRETSMKAIIGIATLFSALAIALPAVGQGLADVTAATGLSNALAGTSAGSAHSAIQAARSVASAASAASNNAGWEAAGESKGGGGGQGWSSGGQASAGKG